MRGNKDLKGSWLVKRPGRDMSHNRKLSAATLMSYLVSQGSSSTCCEILDFFKMSADAPSASVLNQQKAKLKPEAMEELFKEFNLSVSSIPSTGSCKKFRCIAADGSTASFFCRPDQDTEIFFGSEGHSAKVFSVSISMPSMTWRPIPIQTSSCSRYMRKMNSPHSAPLSIHIPSCLVSLISSLVTGDTVLTTTWHMSLKRANTSFSGRRTSMVKVLQATLTTLILIPLISL